MNTKQTELRHFAEAMLDKDRLRIIGALAGGSRDLDRLAGQTGLPPEQLTAHLRKLSRTGLVVESLNSAGEAEFILDEKALENMSRRQFAARRVKKQKVEDKRRLGPSFTEKEKEILNKLIAPDGKIRSIPGGYKVEKIEALVKYVVQFVEPGKTYTEKTFNAIFSEMTQDTASIRRYLVDMGLVGRSRDGATYWLEEKRDV